MNWTQIRHRLPERELIILIWDNNHKSSEISYLNTNKKFTYYDRNDEVCEYEDGIITHWMHMPEAPKEF